jgi:uncharacterized protein (DUF1330 family)
MAVYLVATVDVHDAETFRPYVTDVPAIVEKYGGRYLARGGELEIVDGEWPVRRVTVIEFPTVAEAKRWWSSPEYERYKAIRQRAARTNAVIVNGYGG